MPDFDSGDANIPSSDGAPGSGVAIAEIERLTRYADAQERKVAELRATVAQLQYALDARVATERAIGILAERFDVSMPEAVELLRTAARSSRRTMRSLADELIESSGGTPAPITEA